MLQFCYHVCTMSTKSVAISILTLAFSFFLYVVQCTPQYVEMFVDYKKNHIDDEIAYVYHYHIEHAPTNLQINHREERRGSYVHGQYGLLEPNGNVRQVHYEVDRGRGGGSGGGGGGGGFRAIVQTQTAYSRVLQRLFVSGRQQPQTPWRHAQLIAHVA